MMYDFGKMVDRDRLAVLLGHPSQTGTRFASGPITIKIESGMAVAD
jgi:hypothetical protein